ncbi:MAG: histidinol-phosphate transaminase [Candidatus Sedimenticola sp. (ex Thyasira tokunagai)]
MSRFWSELVDKLTPYVPGEQPKGTDLTKLNTNENPYAPSPRVLAALKEEAAEGLRLYPDPNGDRLKGAVADFYSISPRQVFVGNGSDEVLAHCFQALLKQSQPILFPDITYSFYPVYCGLYDVAYQTVPLTDSFEIDPADYRQPNGGIIFPNPNAPTGCLLPLTAIESILEANPDSVVVVDEAYIDFGGDSAATLVSRYPNLLVIQTLSKSRSLAGLRVGFAIGDEALIEGLERVKNSFNSYPLDRFAIAGGAIAMEDRDYFNQCRQRIINSRDDLAGKLNSLGFQVLPSAANFLFVRHPEQDAETLALKLREKGIIVRYFKKPRIDQFLRITVGTEDECGKLCSALEEMLPG